MERTWPPVRAGGGIARQREAELAVLSFGDLLTSLPLTTSPLTDTPAWASSRQSRRRRRGTSRHRARSSATSKPKTSAPSKSKPPSKKLSHRESAQLNFRKDGTAVARNSQAPRDSRRAADNGSNESDGPGAGSRLSITRENTDELCTAPPHRKVSAKSVPPFASPPGLAS